MGLRGRPSDVGGADRDRPTGKDPSLRVHAQSGGGPSEVDWLNGAVVAAATELGGSAPVNRRLTELFHEVIDDPVRRDWFHGRPDRLVEAVEAVAGR